MITGEECFELSPEILDSKSFYRCWLLTANDKSFFIDWMSKEIWFVFVLQTVTYIAIWFNTNKSHFMEAHNFFFVQLEPFEKR